MEQVEQQQNPSVDFKSLDGGLEILVQLAEKKEIDPWDIDIIEVTDKFLSALDKSPRENLLNAGRGIFYASVLLRMKSEILLNLSNETLASSQNIDNFFPEDDLLFNDSEDIRLDLSKLESFIVRSSLGKQQRKRKITLNDLLLALKQADEEEERRTIRSKLRAERVFSIASIDAPDDVLEMAQDEDIDVIADRIEAIIGEHLTDDKPITLKFLWELMNEKSKVFLAILFLAHAQKVVLHQDKDDFYGEVYIYKAGTVIQEKEEASITIESPIKKGKSKKGGLKDLITKITDKVTGRKKKQIVEMKQDELEVKESFIEEKADNTDISI